MSPTYNSTYTPAPPYPSQEDDLGLDQHQLPFHSSHLSPTNYPQTTSNSASPSYYTNSSTPGESLSEFNYQPSDFSEFDDPFFGVNFDAGVHRIDSIPTALSNDLSDQAGADPIFSDLPPHIEEKQSSETLSTSTYLISPRLTSIANTPSPRSEANDTKIKPTVSQYELITAELHDSYFQPFTPQIATHPTVVQLTPDHSGSSNSSEELELSSMARFPQSPRLTVSQFNNEGQPANTFDQNTGYVPSDNSPSTFVDQYPTHSNRNPELSAMRNDEGVWESSETAGPAGLDPETRSKMGDMELPSLKQQDEEKKFRETKSQVESWRSQAGGSSDDEDRDGETRFRYNDRVWNSESQRVHPPEEDNDIAPLDDALSIHENTLQEGQAYYNIKQGEVVTKTDMEIMNQSRHWSDAPAMPYTTEKKTQPESSDAAIRQWNFNAETMSITSRAATWGTHRRRSEPSQADIKAVADGSIFKKLAIKPKEGTRSRQNSIFSGGLNTITNIVRSRGNSNANSAALKRARSTQNIPSIANGPAEQVRQNSQGSLAPPGHRQIGNSRRQTPSVNTAIGMMTGLAGAVGATHTHSKSGSVSMANTSPRTSPTTHLGMGLMGSMRRRSRSKSELSTQENEKPGLMDLLRAQGGPPVANLASPPIDEQRQFQIEDRDQEEDDEDEEDQAEEGDMKPEVEQEPIIPNYQGFKAHVRRLNPDMGPAYNWLVSRIAHQQEIRYKNLLEQRVKHSQATNARSCASGRHCLSSGGNTVLLDAKGNPREQDPTSLQLVTNFSGNVSDDSNPGEGALTDETFPAGVPMPPSRNLPAEFECQLCFKVKKFQKPSDWTKHVHEDVQPFTCTYDKCKDAKSFKRKADWVRHENELHRHLEWWICQEGDCRHPCYRKDNFLQHLVREHKLPEPKQKTKAAIKKARTTEPVWIKLEQCHYETTQKPQDEPCKFCGKAFNTWKKLTVHLAKHMEHISLPILRLVDERSVDANTIISPVQQIFTPITETKLESTSPFGRDNFSPHTIMAPQFNPGFDPAGYYPTPLAPFLIPAQINHGMPYHPNQMYQPPYAVPPMEQTHGFNSMEEPNLENTSQGRGFGSIGSSYSHPKDQSRGYGSLGSDFSSPLQDQNYTPLPTTGYGLPLNYVTAAPAVSSYQTPNMLGMRDDGYGYDQTSMHSGQPHQGVHMGGSQGRAASYSRSPQNVPQNIPQHLPPNATLPSNMPPTLPSNGPPNMPQNMPPYYGHPQ